MIKFSLDGKGEEITETIEADEKSELLCFYCDTELDLESDYACIVCGRLTCDNHNDVCQVIGEGEVLECEFVTCYMCVKEHTKFHHPVILRRCENE